MKPILFNQDMVKAILDGRKSVTRRVMKPQPHIFGEGLENECKHPTGFFDTGKNEWACRRSGCGIRMNGTSIYHAPYQVGDILYVTETWQIQDLNAPDCMMIKYRADNYTELQVRFRLQRYEKFHKFYYKNGWQSPYFMPKEAARIFLKVTNVRVERLQDINRQGNHDDIFKEGYPFNFITGSPLHDFIFLWNSTIKKSDLDKYDWHANPWVWVIEFERISKEEDYGRCN